MNNLIIYLIRNTIDDELFWNNELGWVDIISSMVFSEDESKTLELPEHGEWVRFVENKS